MAPMFFNSQQLARYKEGGRDGAESIKNNGGDSKREYNSYLRENSDILRKMFPEE
jgi:hypothetical protein